MIKTYAGGIPNPVIAEELGSWVEVTDEEILADHVLLDYWGLNNGKGPVPTDVKRVIRALERLLKVKNAP
jgi:hypothetical protein